MKRIFLIALAAISFTATNAQDAKKMYTKGKMLGLQFTLHDYKTATEIRNGGMSQVLAKQQWNKLSRMRPGLAVNYTEGLNDYFDFNARLGFSYLEYSLANQPFATSIGSKPYFEADANIFMKLTSDQYYVSPFLSVGAGASTWKGYYAAYIPTGAGVQVNLFDQTFFIIQAQYRMPVTVNASHNLFYSFGIHGTIGK
jgi:OOP family OmpA-OmpF porin